MGRVETGGDEASRVGAVDVEAGGLESGDPGMFASVGDAVLAEEVVRVAEVDHELDRAAGEDFFLEFAGVGFNGPELGDGRREVGGGGPEVESPAADGGLEGEGLELGVVRRQGEGVDKNGVEVRGRVGRWEGRDQEPAGGWGVERACRAGGFRASKRWNITNTTYGTIDDSGGGGERVAATTES